MKVLVCGDRYWDNFDLIRKRLAKLPKDTIIIEGECKGADLMAKQAAIELKLEVESYPADWKKYGRAAGPIRNNQMLVEGKPDLVIAFHNSLHKSKGTRNMLNLTRRAKIPFEIHTEHPYGMLDIENDSI